MKKLILLFLVLVLKFAPAKAQWVTIPDPNFVTWLTNNYPSCMNGNQLDTTCAEITNEDTVIVSFLNIADLTGIEYFDNLIYLKCNNNQLTNLPAFPDSLEYLKCDNNQILNLPELPSSLYILDCSYNQLTNLPILPNSLIKLECSYNELSILPTLPNSLIELGCSYNQLTTISALPNTLVSLYCFSNQLPSLPPLPNSLILLLCDNNQLTSLPATLPSGLLLLWCSGNQLSSLPSLPSTLLYLSCFNNQLNSLPSVPNVMDGFKIYNNNISCLINLPYLTNPSLGNISNNPLTCVPNQTNFSLGLPVCLENDSINNPNNCIGVNITGNVYTDMNNNCIYNNTDVGSNNVPVKLLDSLNNLLAQSYTYNGVYSFNNLPAGNYQVKIQDNVLPFVFACGNSSTQNVILDSTNQTIQNINFPVMCNAGNDVYILSVNRSGWVFPGQIHTLETNIADNETWFNITCDEGNTSGIVTINVIGPVSFVAPAAGALTPTVSGNTYTYNIIDFNTLNANSFGLQLMTDTTAQANDQICVHVEISPNPIDADTTNNVYDFCYNVVNSYDPNMKEVYPVNVLPGYDDWFTYTIHFQNTGNAPAFNIRLRDTLDTQLDLNTFEVLGYSHPANVGISGNILTVRFNNIMLPDSTSDYEGSMGYFQYRIKPTPNLPNGSQISNTAYIYFDFNAPIITNTTENNFDITVSATNLKLNPESFEIYPNPSTGVFTFKDAKNIQRVEVYNVMGQEIAVFAGDNTNKVSKQINLSNYSKGIYFAKINGSVVIKLVKE